MKTEKDPERNKKSERDFLNGSREAVEDMSKVQNPQSTLEMKMTDVDDT